MLKYYRHEMANNLIAVTYRELVHILHPTDSKCSRWYFFKGKVLCGSAFSHLMLKTDHVLLPLPVHRTKANKRTSLQFKFRVKLEQNMNSLCYTTETTKNAIKQSKHYLLCLHIAKWTISNGPIFQEGL